MGRKYTHWIGWFFPAESGGSISLAEEQEGQRRLDLSSQTMRRLRVCCILTLSYSRKLFSVKIVVVFSD